MKEFPLPLVIRALLPDELKARGFDHQFYELMQPFTFLSARGPVNVPAGFMTDFASIPQVIWNLLSPEDPVILAPSVAHDWNYTEQKVSKDAADDMLAEAMTVCGAPRWKVFCVFQAVQRFGASHWKV